MALRRSLKGLIWAVGFAAALSTAEALAGGFYIPEQGAKAVGMGNAFAAVADDPSANWYNPAGLAFQGNAIAVSGDVLKPVNRYESGGRTYDAKKSTFFVPQLYAVLTAGSLPLRIGLGVNAPFGLSTDWTNSGAPFSQPGAGLFGANSVTFSQIEAVHSNLNLAYPVSDRFSVAAGFSYYKATKVHLNSWALNIGGSGDGWGGNVALFYRSDRFNAGLSYRSRVKLSISGTAEGNRGLNPVGLWGVSGGVTTSVTLPDLLMAGVAYRPSESWRLMAQIEWVNWKTFDAINLNFAPSALNAITGPSKSIPENWKATTTIRLGAEWSYSPTNRVRLGYVYDPTPTNDRDLSPRLPGNDRQLITLGWGMDVSRAFTVDLAYAYVWLKDRNLTTARTAIYNGVYKSYVHILSAGVNYRF